MTLRRDFLSMTAGAVAARTVLPIVAKAEDDMRSVDAKGSSHPDAELIRLCSAACAMTTQSDLAYETVADIPSRDPRYKPGCDEANRLGDIAYDLRQRVLGMRAHTLDGMRAKAGYVLSDLESNGLASEMAHSIMHDILAMGSATA